MVLLQKTLYSHELQGYSCINYYQKRIFELGLIILFSPIFLLISLYVIYKIKKESPGSIFFKQQRVGLECQNFVCYKFRSMHENTKFNPYTEDNDNRIFPFGILMRKMRLDEIPQLWNVIKGDMHLIGPRAEWDILVDKYKPSIQNYEKRHLVKPGITGLAQVSYPYGRNLYDTKQKLKYDLIYIQNWSLLLDLKITFQTLLVMLGKKGL